MAGRKPLGPALVEHLEGSFSAKERLELILATIAGQVSVVAASERLGISEAMFYKLRTRVLQSCLEDLEPKPLGRPSQVPSAEEVRSQELETQVAELERELAAERVRAELAQTLPHVVASPESAALKKTKLRKQRQKRLRQLQRRKRK
jgi:hypothetical protein